MYIYLFFCFTQNVIPDLHLISININLTFQSSARYRYYNNNINNNAFLSPSLTVAQFI